MENQTVLYVRVSTMEQATKGVSLDAQDERLRSYCTMQGLDVVRVFIEEGVSAGKPLESRPEGRKMLTLLKRKKASHVVALKLDRLFRNAENALRLTSIWDNTGITLHLVDMGGQSLSTSNAIGRMMLTMMAAFAEFERNLVSERTSIALAHKRSKGQAYNHTPYGFDREGDLMVENPEEQRIITLIQQWREQGNSLQGIATKLNNEGIATKHKAQWHPSTVRKILRNDLHQ